MPKRSQISFILVSVFALSACANEKAPETPALVFSAIPDQNSTALQQKFDPVARYLSEALDVPVRYLPSADYQASVEMFRNGDVLLAWFGGLTGVQARAAVPGARAIAQGAEDPEFFSYFIAHRDTGLQRNEAFPTGLKGRSFTFGSRSSTSGRLMPQHFIEQHSGQKPEALFSSVSFSGSHDQTVELVAAGRVEVGVVNYKVYDARVAAGSLDPDRVPIIWKTPPYADYNFTAHPLLNERYGPGFVERLQSALTSMKQPELLAAFPRRALVAARNEDYAGIAKVARSLGMVR